METEATKTVIEVKRMSTIEGDRVFGKYYAKVDGSSMEVSHAVAAIMQCVYESQGNDGVDRVMLEALAALNRMTGGNAGMELKEDKEWN